jgi:ligand-binding sensor domain-containing protein
MNKTTQFLYGLLFLICPLALQGQAPYHYVFRHLSTSDGLLNNEVKAILRDKAGFLWIGTASGLNRYDGCRLKSYISNEKDSCALQEDDIETLHMPLSLSVSCGNASSSLRIPYGCFPLRLSSG